MLTISRSYPNSRFLFCDLYLHFLLIIICVGSSTPVMSQVKPTPAPTLPAYDEGRKAQLEVRATAQEEDYSGFGEIDPYLQETPGDPCGHHFYNPETFDPDKQQRFENEMQKLVTVVNFEESNLTLMEIQSDFEMQRLEIADCRQKILVKYRSFIWS